MKHVRKLSIAAAKRIERTITINKTFNEPKPNKSIDATQRIEHTNKSIAAAQRIEHANKSIAAAINIDETHTNEHTTHSTNIHEHRMTSLCRQTEH